MKRFRLLLCCLVLLLTTNSHPLQFDALQTLYPNATYTFYIEAQDTSDIGECVIDNAGLGQIVRCKLQNSQTVKKKLNHILGESVSFLGTKAEFEKLIDSYQIQVIKREQIGCQIDSVYGVAKGFYHSIVMEQNQVNLQLCYNDGIITIGTPIILGEY